MRLIVVNGHPGAGKDEFVIQCKNVVGALVENVSTVDYVKTIARGCGWDGTKTARNRAFLSELKDLLTKWDDVPYRKVMESVAQFEAFWESYDFNTDNALVFIHCREPKEIAKFVERNHAVTLYIRRPLVDDNVQSNHADSEVENYQYDYYIDNDGTIEDLKEKAEKFIKNLYEQEK